MDQTPAIDLERRKQLRIRLRCDLAIEPQKYEGRTYYVVKDPVSLRYYRFKEQEHFLIQMLDGETTLEQAQKKFEESFRPERLPLEHLEAFAQQLLTTGLAYSDSPQGGKQLFERRKKRRRSELMQMLTNILYIKLPLYDPDKLLERMLPYLRWIFTTWFFVLSVGLMMAAIMLVATHFEAFRNKLPESREFFSFKTVVYMWGALGVVKVIHEFGHGLSCKAFGGEVHEMGALFLVLSPCLYCNVSDAWTLPSKWKRIIISFAGIYVELVIASLATFIWWNSPGHPFINQLSLSLMVVCSVSTVLFNGNPLMRYDGYYILADWIEVPNLRDRCNRYLKTLCQEHCLGMEVQPEPYMALDRRILFVAYAVVSYLYRWVVTFTILWFLYRFLQPYKLGTLSALMAGAAGGSMVGWPLFRMGKAYHKRGRMPNMKRGRVLASAGVIAAVLLFVLFVPLPVSRVRQIGFVQPSPDTAEKVFVEVPGILEHLYVRDGQFVNKGETLADFRSLEVENQLEEARTDYAIRIKRVEGLQNQRTLVVEPTKRAEVEMALSKESGDRDLYRAQVAVAEDRLNRLVLRAPRSGVVMSPPLLDDVGKHWDKEEGKAFCTIGDWKHLQAVVPVPPSDYRLLTEDLGPKRDLPVTIRVQGLASRKWTGKVAPLPQSEAKEVPVQLTTKGGGPLATKPVNRPNAESYLPQNQCYLVMVDIDNPDGTICPGTLAQVKVHCRWRSCAWWVWRTVSLTFDLKLI